MGVRSTVPLPPIRTVLPARNDQLSIGVDESEVLVTCSKDNQLVDDVRQSCTIAQPRVAVYATGLIRHHEQTRALPRGDPHDFMNGQNGLIRFNESGEQRRQRVDPFACCGEKNSISSLEIVEKSESEMHGMDNR
ncbi:MAG: hypothetical protein ABI411_05410 [Tahibacter sp.]